MTTTRRSRLTLTEEDARRLAEQEASAIRLAFDGRSDPDQPRSPEGIPVNRWAAVWRVGFISVWLGSLLDTLGRVWHAPDMGWRIVGLIALAGFSSVYIGTFVWIRKIRVGFLSDPRLGLGWALVALQVVLALAILPAGGETTLATTIFLAVMFMFLLPVRLAIGLVLALAGAVEVLSHTVPGWDPANGLAVQILISTLAIWGIIQMLQRNNQLAQAREEITSLAVSQERLRFSRDLHDILGHTLTVITLKAELAGRLVQIDPDRAEHEIAEVERLARTALADVRSTVAGYRDFGLASQLASARTALDAAGIEAELAGTVDDVPADRLELFGWAVREGVTNVVRHSGAGRCRVSVDRLQVEISDDGRGPGRCPADGEPDPVEHLPGNGLAGLRERAEAVGASLTVGRSAEGGFLLRVAHDGPVGRR